MKSLYITIKILLEKLWFLVFCRRINIGHSVKILQVLYPLVDWSRVSFFEGIPWFARITAPYVTAQALPSTYGVSTFNIYIKKYRPDECGTLADIVHEAYHINQYMHFHKGYGFGFFRTMLVYYNAYYLTHGYRNNPYEEPAYQQEYKFQQFCTKNGISQMLDPYIISSLEVEGMVSARLELKYQSRKIFIPLSVLFMMMVALIKPFIEMIFAILWIILWLLNVLFFYPFYLLNRGIR